MNCRIPFLFLILVLVIAELSYGQKADGSKEFELQTDLVVEELTVVTDRALYAVDEPILFWADYGFADMSANVEWSSVLYVELIKSDGSSMFQGKYPIGENGCSGVVNIPSNLYTGTYYLKAYTKWMRNQSPDHFSYNRLKIVNTRSPEMASSLVENKTQDVESVTDLSFDKIRIQTNKENYGVNERVELSLQLTEKIYKDYSYVISVVKKGAWKQNIVAKQDLIAATTESENSLFFPETRGLTVSGKVTNTVTGEPIPDALVFLSMLDSKAFFTGYKTLANGDFYFSLPDNQNEKDFFVSTYNTNSTKIVLDDEFCEGDIHITTSEFKLNENEENMAKEFSVNAQVMDRYNKVLCSSDQVTEDTTSLSFFGKASKEYYTKDYINLPFLDEFIFEIIPEIRVETKDNIQSIKPTTWNSFHNYPFLVLVDDLPIFDIASVLKIKTENIARIEVVNAGYAIGALKFSGVMNVRTLKHDLAGIDLPENAAFFNYKLYADTNHTFCTQAPNNARIPDRRNCLLWIPNIELNAQTLVKKSFITADVKGEYEVIFQAISRDSKEIYVARESFFVK